MGASQIRVGVEVGVGVWVSGAEHLKFSHPARLIQVDEDLMGPHRALLRGVPDVGLEPEPVVVAQCGVEVDLHRSCRLREMKSEVEARRDRGVGGWCAQDDRFVGDAVVDPPRWWEGLAKRIAAPTLDLPTPEGRHVVSD